MRRRADRPIVPVLHDSAAARAALRRGFPRRSVRMVPCRTMERIERALRSALADAVVVDVGGGRAGAAFALAARYPAIPFFAFSVFRPDDGRLLAACRSAGLRGVLIEGVDDAVSGELVAARSASRARRAALSDAPRLLRLLEPLQRRAWEEVLRRAGTRTTTADIARAVGHTREHLSREFAAGGAPNLKRVLDLARTVCAADLLRSPGYDVQTVAGVLGYSSASHLASASRRVAGVTPGELGALGIRGVFQRFLKGRTRSRL